MIQYLPTDRFGQVYYGPTTFLQAEEQISSGRNPGEMADMLWHAGYTGVAQRVAREYNLEHQGEGRFVRR